MPTFGFTLDTPVGNLAAERPALVRVFERLGIDYCCAGQQPLRQACAAKCLDPASVLAVLAACDPRDNADDHGDWFAAPASQLIDHIVAEHHGYLRAELPRLARLIAKVVEAHGRREPQLAELPHVFAAFQAELDSHMMKEERILFPTIRQIEAARGPVVLHCGSVRHPIGVMLAEHDSAGTALARFREFTHDYSVPAEACNTYRAMIEGLRELEVDMHRHIHEENNILFPWAARAEAALADRH